MNPIIRISDWHGMFQQTRNHGGGLLLIAKRTVANRYYVYQRRTPTKRELYPLFGRKALMMQWNTFKLIW